MVREYTKYDYDEVSSWFHSRKIEITEDYLPQHGFIEPGIAAGFIYMTDANFCIFESFISNPEASKEEKEIALREVVMQMIKKAKELEFKEIYGFATSQKMITIGYEQGFKHVENCATIRKELM